MHYHYVMLLILVASLVYMVMQRLEIIRQDKKIEGLRDQHEIDHRTIRTMRFILEERGMGTVLPILSKARSVKGSYGSN